MDSEEEYQISLWFKGLWIGIFFNKNHWRGKCNPGVYYLTHHIEVLNKRKEYIEGYS